MSLCLTALRSRARLLDSCCSRVFMTAIGLSPLLCVVAFLIYFILATAIARMRAELGPPVHDLHFSGPGLHDHEQHRDWEGVQGYGRTHLLLLVQPRLSLPSDAGRLRRDEDGAQHQVQSEKVPMGGHDCCRRRWPW